MKKWVLAPNMQAYRRFINKLWSLDKDISNYGYIRSYESMRGIRAHGDQLIKLRGWDQHPDHDLIISQALACGMEIPRRGNTAVRTERLRGINPSFSVIDEMWETTQRSTSAASLTREDLEAVQRRIMEYTERTEPHWVMPTVTVDPINAGQIIHVSTPNSWERYYQGRWVGEQEE